MKRTLACTIALLLAAPAAVGEEVQFGWRTLAEYDSELSTQDGGIDDGIFTAGPVTTLSGEHRRFNYELQHFSGFEKYVSTSQLDDWRHELNARLHWQPAPRVQIDVTNSFLQLPQLRSGVVEDAAVGDVEDDPALNLESRTVTTNLFTTKLTAYPLQTVVASTELSVVYREFDDPTLTQQNTVSTTTTSQLLHQISEDFTWGGGFRFSNRDFETGLPEDAVDDERVDTVRDASTQTYEAYGVLNWTIDDRSTFSARLGPAWSTDDRDEPEPAAIPAFSTLVTTIAGDPTRRGFIRDPGTCPAENVRPDLGGVVLNSECGVFNQAMATGFEDGITGDELDDLLDLEAGLPFDDPDDASDSNASLFFSFTLDRRWNRFDASITWTRSDSQTEALGSATVVDSLLLRSRYFVTSRMRLNGAFRFTRRFSDVEREQLFLVVDETSVPIPEASLPGFDPVVGFPVIATTTEDASFTQTRDSYSLRLELARDWGRWSSAYVAIAYRYQNSEVDSELDFQDFDLDTDSFLFQLGFTYRFRPIRF